jgi:hypothetical protein
MWNRSEEIPVPDHEDAAVAIAQRSLQPLLMGLHETLDRADSRDVARHVLTVAAEAYAAGHRDGVRHAVADIAPIAASHGLQLWLGPELCEDAGIGHPERRAGGGQR